MKIKITKTFEKIIKKVHRNQIKLVENAIDKIANDPEIGELKKGDLAGIRVYKFYLHNQLILLAYYYNNGNEITLLSLGTHQNFYKNLKKKI
ncbi:MAG: hypothetical protein ACD_60C00137G0015 [uncultured bacterium]|nr:MAG: hypothetical protein ACD_60C00137G0015 [uncultured bacterium]